MRAVKKASLGFGLVNVPVRMYLATESHDVGFHQHHQGCNGAIGMARTCKDCGEVVPYADIVSGIKRDGKLVTLTKDELAGLEDERGAQIEVLQFCQAGEIDPILFDENTYYLEANGGDPKGYPLLRQALLESNLVGVVRYVMRTRQHLGILRVIGNVMVIHPMHWPDEVRSTGELKIPDKVDLDPKAVKLAHMLVESLLVERFDPEQFTDTYTARVDELIDVKAAGAPVVASAEDTGTEDVSDLLAALEKSIQRHPAGKQRDKTPARKRPPAA
jgi:DNA end-binding protein Ku